MPPNTMSLAIAIPCGDELVPLAAGVAILRAAGLQPDKTATLAEIKMARADLRIRMPFAFDRIEGHKILSVVCHFRLAVSVK